MPTVDWLNRASAFTTRMPYWLLEQMSVHTPTVQAGLAPVQAGLATARPAPVEGRTKERDGLGMSGQLDALLA